MISYVSDINIHNKVKYIFFDKSYEGEDNKISELLVKTTMGADALVTAKQVHGPDVAIVNSASHPTADAIITTKKNLAVAVKVADCVPVVLTNKTGSIVGAMHCGWKSVVSGVILNCVDAMGQDLYAAIGPSIQQYSYEVQTDMMQRFADFDRKYSNFIAEHKGKFFFDLSGYVSFFLEKLGVTIVNHSKEDTYKNPDLYYSHRRAVYNGKKERGRMFFAIMRTG